MLLKTTPTPKMGESLSTLQSLKQIRGGGLALHSCMQQQSITKLIFIIATNGRQSGFNANNMRKIVKKAIH